MATPVFVLNAGRSGSEAIVKALRHFPEPEMEAYHEFLIHHMQPLVAKYIMGILLPYQVRSTLKQLLSSAIQLSDARLWLDSCNKISWVALFLYEMYPDALFVHLTRDGRRVTSSYYHKLSQEAYHPADVLVLRNWLNKVGIQPPPMKKYWWPLPEQGLDQWGNICWHWAANNRAILDGLTTVPAARQLTVKLEEITTNRQKWNDVLNFLDLGHVLSYEANAAWESLQKPTNVRQPVSHPLTDAQEAAFWRLCGDMMARLGYTGPDYEVAYVDEDRPPKGKIYGY